MNQKRLWSVADAYRNREASLGKAAAIAGMPVGQMINVLSDYGVESNLEKEDYLKSLENLRKV